MATQIAPLTCWQEAEESQQAYLGGIDVPLCGKKDGGLRMWASGCLRVKPQLLSTYIRRRRHWAKERR